MKIGIGKRKKHYAPPKIKVGHKLKIGETVERECYTGSNDSARGKKFSGRVVYIHPEGRFHTVRFDHYMGSYLESYHGDREIEYDDNGARDF